MFSYLIMRVPMYRKSLSSSMVNNILKELYFLQVLKSFLVLFYCYYCFRKVNDSLYRLMSKKIWLLLLFEIRRPPLGGGG